MSIFRNIRKNVFPLGVCALALLLTTMAGAVLARQVTVVPGSVMRGEQLLDDKGCLLCHAVNGRGGGIGPDFTKSPRRAKTPARFATALWNHSPKMWAAFENAGRPVPPLTSEEMADIFAFFYSTLYFSPPGSAARGRSVFEDKRCVSCHGQLLDPRPDRSGLHDWTDVKDPIAWAEQMWNHANEMDTATQNRGIRWPKLSEQDVVDLLLFLSKLPEAQTEMPAFRIGEPGLGRIVFERSCESCHSFGAADRSKVDLLARSRPSSITGYIAAMWNHAPDMRRRAGSTPELKPGEMPDLIAFLFSQRYFQDRGDVLKGRRVFEEKSCAVCHESRRKETGAPDLAQVTETFSPITLTAAVWKHGPTMMGEMKRMNISWPEFKDQEMPDLIAYLNSRLIPRIAQPSRSAQ